VFDLLCAVFILPVIRSNPAQNKTNGNRSGLELKTREEFETRYIEISQREEFRKLIESFDVLSIRHYSEN
jgi:hypothetical protein